MIELATPDIGDLEARRVAEAIASGFVSSVGPNVSLFEEMFADYVGAAHAVACSSGTAALHVAMRLAGVVPGDRVVVSDFTFIASANAVGYQFADLTLVDSSAETWCMDPVLLEAELERMVREGEPLPKAIELVHILGQPGPAREVRALADRYGIFLIEDAAEALGATIDVDGVPRSVGTFGDVSAFSFNGNKIMTTGGGGMLVTDDPELARRAKHLTTQARVADAGYLHDEIGFNYRLTNVAAALGVAQLERLPAFVDAKRRIAARYTAAFAGTGVEGPPRVSGTDSTYWLYSILVPRGNGSGARDGLQAHLRERGIDSRPLWRPLHDQPALSGSRPVGGSVGEEIFERGLSLPSSTHLRVGDQDRVIDAVLEWLDGASA